MKNAMPSKRQLFVMVTARILVSVPVFLAMFFWPAGTFDYWQAWVYLAVILVPMLIMAVYLFKYSPELLARRMQMKEKETEQKRIIGASLIYFVLAFILPGFDHRFGWSHVPTWLVLLADGVVLLSFALVFWVFRENQYASRIIEVAQDQKVISSGPYSLVRHPMYLGSGTMYIMSSLALGSYWAILPALLIVPLLAARIKNEEAVLLRDLSGYRDYMQRVKYRILPGVW